GCALQGFASQNPTNAIAEQTQPNSAFNPSSSATAPEKWCCNRGVECASHLPRATGGVIMRRFPTLARSSCDAYPLISFLLVLLLATFVSATQTRARADAGCPDGLMTPDEAGTGS